MSDNVPASFIITVEQKAFLKKLAVDNERSISYILRQILQDEQERRRKQPAKQTQPSQK